MIQTLSAPYSKVRFMSTCAVNAENIQEYIQNEKIIASSRTWMIDAKAIK